MTLHLGPDVFGAEEFVLRDPELEGRRVAVSVQTSEGEGLVVLNDLVARTAEEQSADAGSRGCVSLSGIVERKRAEATLLHRIPHCAFQLVEAALSDPRSRGYGIQAAFSLKVRVWVLW